MDYLDCCFCSTLKYSYLKVIAHDVYLMQHKDAFKKMGLYFLFKNARLPFECFAYEVAIDEYYP